MNKIRQYRTTFLHSSYGLSVCDSNGIRTHNHLARKRPLNHLVKLAKWLNFVMSIYLYSVYDYILLSSHVRVLEWIYTLSLAECRGTPCLKETRYLNFSSSNGIPTHNHLVRKLLNYLATLTKWLNCVVSTYM